MYSQSAAKQKENKGISSSTHEEDAAKLQNSVNNVQSADNVTPETDDTTEHNTPPDNGNGNIPRLASRMTKLKMPGSLAT